MAAAKHAAALGKQVASLHWFPPTRRSVGGHDSLMRSSQTEIVNICVASVCLVPLLAVGGWFGARTLAALRCPTTVRWGRQRRYLLAMTGLDLVLQLINLAIFLGSNIYSLAYPCALYAPAMDVFFLLSMTSERGRRWASGCQPDGCLRPALRQQVSAAWERQGSSPYPPCAAALEPAHSPLLPPPVQLSTRSSSAASAAHCRSSQRAPCTA